jgi:hypothetical protein
MYSIEESDFYTRFDDAIVEREGRPIHSGSIFNELAYATSQVFNRAQKSIKILSADFDEFESMTPHMWMLVECFFLDPRKKVQILISSKSREIWLQHPVVRRLYRVLTKTNPQLDIRMVREEQKQINAFLVVDDYGHFFRPTIKGRVWHANFEPEGGCVGTAHLEKNFETLWEFSQPLVDKDVQLRTQRTPLLKGPTL